MKYAVEIKIWNGYICEETGKHIREHSEVGIYETDDPSADDITRSTDWGWTGIEICDDKEEAEESMNDFLESNTDVKVLEYRKLKSLGSDKQIIA